jgi:hypothetical protein
MKKLLLLSITLLMCFMAAKAQSIMGSNITYTSIDSVKYIVTVKIYQDCKKSTNVWDSVKVEWNGGANSFYDRIYKVAENDVSGYGPNCIPQSSCGDTGYYGIREIIFKDTIDLTGINACEFVISWIGKREPTISMTVDDYYNFSTLNKCLAQPNASVSFANTPVILAEKGQDFVFNPGAYDQSSTADSISYAFVCPLQSPTSNATNFVSSRCAGCMSACSDCPINFLGAPNSGLPFPSGCHFDTLGGGISVRPTTSQFAYYCIAATEWRKISGTMTAISTVRYETSIIVIDTTGNHVPKIMASSANACSNQNTCINFTTTDADANDSTFIKITGAPQGATISISRNGQFATASVCWTPGNEHVSSLPYSVIAEVRDNACPIPGRATVSKSFLVKQTPDSSNVSIGLKSVQCNEATVRLNFKGSVPGMTYWVEPVDSVITWKAHGNDSVTISFADTGWRKFSIRIRSSVPCVSAPIIDSVYIPTLAFTPPLFIPNSSTSVCLGDSVFFKINLFSTAVPFEFSWSGGFTSTQQNFTYAPTKTDEYIAAVIDGNRCAAAKKVKITVNPLPVIEAGATDTVCPRTPFQLTAQPVSGSATPFKYYWVGVDSLQTVTTTISNQTVFNAYAIDKNGCKSNTDSVTIVARPITLTIPADTGICLGASATLLATVKNPKGAVTYNWQGIANTPAITVNPLKTTKYKISITDSFGCMLTDSVTIKVDTIKLSLTPNKSICYGGQTTLTATAAGPIGNVTYNWLNTGLNTATITVSPLATTVYTVEATDSLGCKKTDSVKVTVVKMAVITPADTTLCAESSVILPAIVQNGTAPIKYLWSLGDTTDNLSITVKFPTTVYVTATDVNGCTAHDTTKISIFPHDTAKLTPLPTLCENDPQQQLLATPAGGFWFGTGITNNSFFNPSISGLGAHSIKYLYTNKYSCTDSFFTTLTVYPLPQPNFVIDIDSGFLPLKIKLINTTPGNTSSWEWKIENTDSNFVYTSTDENPEFTITKAAVYSITLKTGNGNCFAEITRTKAVKAYVNTTGIAKIPGTVFSIYPNPASKELFIDGGSISTLELTDLQGRSITVDLMQMANNQYKVLLPVLSPGMYFLKITDSNKNAATYKLQVDN